MDLIRKKSKLREYVEAIVSALLIAFVLRSFVIEAFKIPSGSMIPTLLVGDHIFVNKFIFGLRVPFTHHYLFRLGEPKRGDVIVFIYPVEEDKDFIKRVVGLPGDRLEIVDNEIKINGEVVGRQSLDAKQVQSEIPLFPGWEHYDFFEERLGDVTHLVQLDHTSQPEKVAVAVPPDSYFMMGDNRDNSADSREWGFVSRSYIKGKAMFVWLSWDSDGGGVRWNRFGHWIK